MEFKTYDPEEEDYLDDAFEAVLKRPGDVEKYRKVIKKALEDAEEVLGLSSGVEILFGHSDTEKVQEKWGEDATANFYVYGFTFGSWFDDVDKDFIFIRANDFYENWKAALKNMVIHERAHIAFYDEHSDEALSKKLNGSNYNSVLFEGHSTNTAAKLNEEKGYGWEPYYRQLGEADPDYRKLMEELKKDRPDSEFFDHGGDEWTEGEGYIISYELFHWIMENRGLELEDLPGLDEEKVRELVDEAAEELYL